MDNVSTNRLFYSFIAAKGTEGLWSNTALVKPEEVRSFDDLLDPKWKGKIGFSDPRVAGSGLSLWSFLWDIKGEEYLKKLVQQELFLSQNLRQITDALAKGRLSLAIGIGYAKTEPFVKSGLPLKELPSPREGLPASISSLAHGSSPASGPWTSRTLISREASATSFRRPLRAGAWSTRRRMMCLFTTTASSSPLRTSPAADYGFSSIHRELRGLWPGLPTRRTLRSNTRRSSGQDERTRAVIPRVRGACRAAMTDLECASDTIALRFTEGFDTANLKAAKTLLDGLR